MQLASFDVSYILYFKEHGVLNPVAICDSLVHNCDKQKWIFTISIISKVSLPVFLLFHSLPLHVYAVAIGKSGHISLQL